MATSAKASFELGRAMGQRTMSEQSVFEVSEDELLVGAVRDGNREAFGRLYDRYARMVHVVLLAKVPPGEVDDLVQDVFIAALRGLSSLREPAKFGAWIAAIGRSRAHDFHRSSTPVDSLDDEDGAEKAESAKEGEDDRAAAVLAAIRSLPEALP